MLKPGKTRRCWIHLLVVLTLQAGVAWAHPQLLLQIDELNRQIIADPENAELLVKRGDLHRRHLDFDRAAEDFKAARAAQPDYAVTDYLEARLNLDAGHPESAVSLLSRYLEDNPKHAAAWLLRGRGHIRMGQPAIAAGDFTTAISTSPKPSPEIYRLQVFALAAQDDRHDAAVLNAVDAALEKFPYELSLRGMGVDFALGTGRAELADSYLEHLPEKLQTLPDWQSRIASAQCMGDSIPSASEQCFAEAESRLNERIARFMSET